jgi:hypothetical protein
MPIYELACGNESCPEYARVFEKYYSTSDKPDPVCACGQQTRRLISSFSVVFSGPITRKYLNPKIEGYDRMADGTHWQFETRGPDGQKCDPRPVKIETFQQQREFAKRNGLVDPSSIGECEVHSDGKGVSTRGMPGAWI